ncbi:BppU family phage baseplate upper protein, partial [Enterococcus hirae]
MSKWNVVLSTTEPYNYVGMIQVRQGDVSTQKLVVEVVEHGILKTFDGLVPFFINTTKFGENQPVEQKVQEYSPGQARLVYTLSEPDWQWGGENTAHFSFRSLNGDGTWSEQFSTQDFTYRVISGISRSQLRDSGYVWTFEDLLRKFKDYMVQGKNDWEQWLEDNREILESIDPGGTIINILNEAKGNYESLADRLDDIQNKKLSVSSSVRQIT